MDFNSLMNNFLGSNQNPNPNSNNNGFNSSELLEKAKQLAGKASNSGVTSFAGGAAAGGLLTLLLSNSKARDIAGSALGYGGAALIGALAHKAYQNYKANHNSSPAVNKVNATENEDLTNERNVIILIKAMVAASKSDGHIDAEEQTRIFNEIDKMNLPSDQKSLVLDFLVKPITISELSSNIHSQELAAEIYLASCMVIDLDHPEEHKHLNELAKSLNLPRELVDNLNYQVKSFSTPKA